MNMSSLTYCFFFYNIAMLHGEFVELYAEYNLSYMLEHAIEIASM